MLKLLMKWRIKKMKPASTLILPKEVQNAKSVLFAVFARYGDGVIAFAAIKKFIKAHPDKKYLLFTTPQHSPYAKEILGELLEVAVFVKKNPISFMKSIRRLKKQSFDIAYNPWSHGQDSEFIASFAKRYFFYSSFAGFDKNYNLHQRAAEYLGLEWQTPVLGDIDLPEDARNIVIAPLSTDMTKSLSIKECEVLIGRLSERYLKADITVAASKEWLKGFGLKNQHIKAFAFAKTTQNSEQFLNLIKESDLFVGVDAGPLHIAQALEKPTLAIFGPTAPHTILGSKTNAVCIRDKKLNGVFCFVQSCKKPVCIEGLFNEGLLTFKNSDMTLPQVETGSCPL